MHILTRVTNLVRGTLAQWIRRREHRNPAAVYEAAIEERIKQYWSFAVDRDDDRVALGLITRRDELRGEVRRLTGELTELTGEAEAAKRNLIAFHEDIARLRDEKVRMLARLANANARARLQQTLNGFTTDADLRALDAVREHIERQVGEVQLGRDLADTELEGRLGAIRDAEASAAARAQLDELKRSRKRRLLPVTLSEARPVA